MGFIRKASFVLFVAILLCACEKDTTLSTSASQKIYSIAEDDAKVAILGIFSDELNAESIPGEKSSALQFLVRSSWVSPSTGNLPEGSLHVACSFSRAAYLALADPSMVSSRHLQPDAYSRAIERTGFRYLYGKTSVNERLFDDVRFLTSVLVKGHLDFLGADPGMLLAGGVSTARFRPKSALALFLEYNPLAQASVERVISALVTGTLQVAVRSESQARLAGYVAGTVDGAINALADAGIVYAGPAFPVRQWAKNAIASPGLPTVEESLISAMTVAAHAASSSRVGAKDDDWAFTVASRASPGVDMAAAVQVSRSGNPRSTSEEINFTPTKALTTSQIRIKITNQLSATSLPSPDVWIAMEPSTLERPYSLVKTGCGNRLSPNQSCTMILQFMPLTSGTFKAALKLSFLDYRKRVRGRHAISIAGEGIGGVLDPAFNSFDTSPGIFAFSGPLPLGNSYHLLQLPIQFDSLGRIYVMGTIKTEPSTPRAVFVLGLTPDGNPRLDFADQGLLIANDPNGATTTFSNGLVFDENNIFMMGSRYSGVSPNFLMFGKMDDKGVIDSRIGTNGWVVWNSPTPGFDFIAGSVQKMRDGSIFGVGCGNERTDGIWSGCGVSLYSLLSDGTPNRNFSGDGHHIIQLDPVGLDSAKLMQVGYVGDEPRFYIAAFNQMNPGYGSIIRVLPDGSLDALYGNAGLSPALFENQCGFYSGLHLLPDHRIFLFGSNRSNCSGINYGLSFVTRFTAQGELDPTWGDHGRVNLDPIRTYDNHIGASVLDSQSRLVLCRTGYTAKGNSFAMDGIRVTRLDRYGQPDASFGDHGHVEIIPLLEAALPKVWGSSLNCSSIGVDPNGRIVIGLLDFSSRLYFVRLIP